MAINVVKLRRENTKASAPRKTATLAASPATKSLQFPSRTKRISRTDRKFFTEQLALLLETGTPLVSALDLIAVQADNSGLKAAVESIANAVREGSTFASALRAHPEAFPSTYATLVEASEQGGYLDRVLRHLLDMENKRDEMQATMVSAFTYPAFLMTFSLGVVVFILGVVFPKFADLFASIANELPATTKVLMAISNVIAEHTLWLILGIGVALLMAIYALTRPGTIASLLAFAEKIPGIGGLMSEFYLTQSMRLISLSLANGVTLVSAIEACEGAVASPKFNGFLQGLRERVTEGRDFAGGFSEATFVPALARQMIVTGEQSGKLELVTRRIADHYQEHLERRLKALSKIVEPVMLLVMGVVVGLIVSSLILPIFKLSRAVH